MCDQSIDTLSSGNHIVDTVIKIDKLQKEIASDYNTCITCETSLVTSANNTIPVTFTLCGNSLFESILEMPATLTSYYRIEAVRDRRFVTLRLLEAVEVEETYTLTATDYTCILDLRCVCAMQCFAPITVTTCVRSTTS